MGSFFNTFATIDVQLCILAVCFTLSSFARIAIGLGLMYAWKRVSTFFYQKNFYRTAISRSPREWQIKVWVVGNHAARQNIYSARICSAQEVEVFHPLEKEICCGKFSATAYSLQVTSKIYI